MPPWLERNYANSNQAACFSVRATRAMRADAAAVYCCLVFALLYVICIAETHHKRMRTVELMTQQESSFGQLLTDLVRESRRQRRRPSRCLAVLADPRHASRFATWKSLSATPLLLTWMAEGDVVSRRNTSQALEALHVARNHGCSVVAIFLQNGRQLARLLKRADRLRLLVPRMHLIVPWDARLFVPALHELWRRMVNVVFVREAPPSGLTRCFKLSSVTFPVPADVDHPETWLPVTLNTWCDGRFRTGNSIFYDKTRNLKYQNLKVAFYKHMPSSIELTSEIEPAIPGVSLHGVEIELVALLSRAMRFHALLVEEVGVNRSEGVVDSVVAGRADLALASLPHVPHFLQRLDLSQPYAAHCFTFMTPEALGDLSWYTLLLPFTPDLWKVSAASLVIAWLALYVVARLQMQRSRLSRVVPSLLYTWRMQLLVSVPCPPRGWPLRTIFGCMWMHCLLLAVAYRSSFAAQLARPPPRFAVDSLSQLAVSPHLQPVTWAQHARELLVSSDDASSQVVGKRLRTTEVAALEVAAQVAAGTTAFLENEHLLRHVRQLWQQHVALAAGGSGRGFRLHVMQECVATLPVSLGLARNSALTERVGTVLRRATEMGLVDKWLRDATATSPRDKARATPQRQQALVNLPKMAGAMVALAAGYALGIVAIIAEMIHFRYHQRRQLNK